MQLTIYIPKKQAQFIEIAKKEAERKEIGLGAYFAELIKAEESRKEIPAYIEKELWTDFL